MKPIARTLTGATAAVLLGLPLGAPAHADPANAKTAFPFEVVCDNGQTYDAVANGSGAFTPAHDLSSTAILIPVSFGEITFTVTDSEGNILDQETSPPIAKKGAAAHNKHATTSCEFFGSATDGDITFTVEGTVTGFVTR